MEQIITCKLKLVLTEEQKADLLYTVQQYNKAMNFVLQDNFTDKLTNDKKLHPKYYSILKENFHLNSQTAINVYRHSGHIYKTRWTRAKTKRDYSIFDKPPIYKALTMKYTFNRNISIFKAGMLLSISSLNSRIKHIQLKGWKKHYDLIQYCKLSDPMLKYDKNKKEFYLLLPITVNVEEQKHKSIIGLDSGIRNPIVAASHNEVKFYDKPEIIKERKTKIQEKRRELYSKGTRSSKRRLKSMSRRERLFVSDWSHCLAKQIIADFPSALFIMEDLTDIRQNTLTFRKEKEDRRQREQWNFAEIQDKIAYKSVLYSGIRTEKIDPAYTSQACPDCGYVSEDNRSKGSEIFTCQNCGLTKNADEVGAINIRFKGLTVSQPHCSGRQTSSNKPTNSFVGS